MSWNPSKNISVLNSTQDECMVIKGRNAWSLKHYSKVLSYIIYYDNNYLVVEKGNDILCYKINDGEDITLVLGDENIKLKGEKADISDLPDQVKGIVAKEMI